MSHNIILDFHHFHYSHNAKAYQAAIVHALKEMAIWDKVYEFFYSCIIYKNLGQRISYKE